MGRLEEMEKDFRDYEARIGWLKLAEPVVQTMERANLPKEIRDTLVALRLQLKSPLNVNWVENQINSIKEKINPKLNISINETNIPVETWSNVKLILTNASTVAAKDINIIGPDFLNIEGALSVPYLSFGTAELPIRIRPLWKGGANAPFEIKYKDVCDFAHTIKQTIELDLFVPVNQCVVIALPQETKDMQPFEARIEVSNVTTNKIEALIVDLKDAAQYFDLSEQTVSFPPMNIGDNVVKHIDFKPKFEGTFNFSISYSINTIPYFKNNYTVRVLGLTRNPVPKPITQFEPQPGGLSTFPQEISSGFYDTAFIGRGGFARVFRARRKSDNRIIAVKIPLSLDESTGRGFVREIRVWEDLKHENIVTCLDCNVLPIPYLILEYMSRGSLEDYLTKQGKPLEVAEVVRISLGIAKGLKYAHNIPPQGIIHRDLKPGNILLTEELVPKITDWGLSKVVAESRSSAMVSFSLLYAAPEQVSPKRFGQADKRTDIYQLGTIMFKTATKTTPFSGDDITEVMGKIINDEPDPPSAINPEAKIIDQIILKCLAKKKEARYQKIEDLEKDLSKCLEQEFTQSWQNSTGSTARSAYFITKLLQLHIQNEQAADALQDCLNLKIYSQNTDLAELIDELQYMAERDIGIDQELKEKGRDYDKQDSSDLQER